QNNLATALWSQASAATGADRTRLLDEAVKACRAALAVLTREALPQVWAMIQNNLAGALGEQASAVSGEERAQLLGEAVEAKRSALTLLTADQYPDWHREQLTWIAEAEAEIRELEAQGV